MSSRSRTGGSRSPAESWTRAAPGKRPSPASETIRSASSSVRQSLPRAARQHSHRMSGLGSPSMAQTGRVPRPLSIRRSRTRVRPSTPPAGRPRWQADTPWWSPTAGSGQLSQTACRRWAPPSFSVETRSCARSTRSQLIPTSVGAPVRAWETMASPPISPTRLPTSAVA